MEHFDGSLSIGNSIEDFTVSFVNGLGNLCYGLFEPPPRDFCLPLDFREDEVQPQVRSVWSLR